MTTKPPLDPEDDALRAENERLKAEFREQFQAEHIAYAALRREIEHLKAMLAALGPQAASG